jgi:predicted transcriptional regulator
MTQIQSMMAKNLITIPSGSTVASAQDIFREKRIRHLPVVNQEGHITGLLQSQNLPLSQELKNL